MSDPSGHWPFFVITAIVGAVVGAVVGGAIAAANGQNVWAGVAIGAVAGALIGTGVGMATGMALAGTLMASMAEVVAGGVVLATTVSTSGVGAGAAFVSNNISRAVSSSAPAVQAIPKTTVYRSVSSAEAADIKATGRFNLIYGGFEGKQFGLDLAETQEFGSKFNQDIIVSARVPTYSLNGYHLSKGIDTGLFNNGVLTVSKDKLDAFNQAVGGTITFMP